MKMKSDDFVPAKKHAPVTTGEAIRMLRELKGWTQEELAKQSGINAKNISTLENDHIDIGKRRAEQLAKAFKVHPAIIMFPEYEGEQIQHAA
jgi:transcriptional regulator with XRE-family HTH domain